MKYIITERQLKMIDEQETSSGNEKINGTIEKLNDVFSSAIIKFNEEEDYGLEPGKFKWFKRRIADFNDILARNVRYIYNGEFEYLMDEKRERFINLILIYTLMDFFYKFDEEYNGEDFERNGEQEGWTYFVKDIYGDELGRIYDEVKNK
jgi:hypothetical protein